MPQLAKARTARQRPPLCQLTKRSQLFRLARNELAPADRGQPAQCAQKHRADNSGGQGAFTRQCGAPWPHRRDRHCHARGSEDYQAFEAAVIADYDAETAVERELVLRLASVLWRLRRATGIETALFESVTAEPGKVEHESSGPTLIEAAAPSDPNQLHLVATTRQFNAAPGNDGCDTKKNITDCFLRLAVLPTFALDRLSRYEHLLWRQARQIVFTLKSLQRRKREPIRSTFPFSFRRRDRVAFSEDTK